MRKGTINIVVFLLVIVFATNCFAQLAEREIEHRLEMARKYLRERNYRMAELNAKKVLELSPGDLSAKEVIAQVQQARNQVAAGAAGPMATNAEEDLLARWQSEEATSEERKEAGAKLSELYLDRAQNLMKRRGKVTEILLNLRKAKVLNPDNGWVHYELFKTFHKLKRLEECLPHAKRFLELVGFGVVATDVRRKLSEVQMEIGDHFVKESRWDRAAVHFREVLKLQPSEQVTEEAQKKLATALRTLFYHLHGKQQYAEAADYLDQLMALRPTDVEQRKVFDAEHYNKLRRYAAEVFWRAALTMRKRKKFDKALAFIARLLESGPSTVRRKEALALKNKIMEEQVVEQQIAPVDVGAEGAQGGIEPLSTPEGQN